MRGVRRPLTQSAVVLAVFGLTVGIAELAGAASLGVAFGFGQIAFVLAVGWAMLRL
jgi:hypothetical protein